MVTEMLDATNRGGDGAAGRVMASAMPDDLAFDGVFLVGEFQSNVVGLVKQVNGTCEYVEPCPSSAKTNIAEAERFGVSCVARVLAWPEKEEEGQGYHVGYAVEAGGRRGVGDGGHVGYDAERDGFDSAWWGIVYGVRPELAVEAEVSGACVVFSRGLGPQTRARLPNGS